MNFRFAILFLTLCAYYPLHSQEEDSLEVESYPVDSSYEQNRSVTDTIISYEYAADIIPRKFDSNFKSRYKSEDFQYEPIIKHYTQWEQFKEWVKSWLRKIFKAQNDQQTSAWFDYLVKFLALLLVIAVVYFIVKAIMNKEGGWIWGRDSQEPIIDHTNIEEKLHLANFKDLIARAQSNHDYRLTVRYYYLWLLRKMSDKNIIQWDTNKTNMDYLYEIKNKALRDRFAYNCYLYDYIWYGEFELNQEAYLQAEISFKETIGAIDGQ